MLRAIVATAAIVAFAGAASAECSSSHLSAKKSSTITTAQISTPDSKSSTAEN